MVQSIKDYAYPQEGVILAKLTNRQIEELKANFLWDEQTRDITRSKELEELNKKRKIRLRVKTK